MQAPSLAPPPKRTSAQPPQQPSETSDLYTPVVKQQTKQQKQQQQMQQQPTIEAGYSYVERHTTQLQPAEEAVYSNVENDSIQQQQQQQPRSRQNTMPVLQKPPQALPRSGKAKTYKRKPISQPQPPPPYSSINASQPVEVKSEAPPLVPSGKQNEGGKRKQKALPPPPSSEEPANLENYFQMNAVRAERSDKGKEKALPPIPQEPTDEYIEMAAVIDESSGIYSLAGPEEDTFDNGLNSTSPDTIWNNGAEFGALHSPPPTEPPPPLPDNIYDVR